MNLKQKVEIRNAGREDAKAISQIITESLSRPLPEIKVEFTDAFWNEIAKIFPEFVTRSTNKPTYINEMSEAQAVAFGATIIPFGKHKGKRVDDVDLAYLVWLADEPDTWRNELRRYVKSKRIQRELEK